MHRVSQLCGGLASLLHGTVLGGQLLLPGRQRARYSRQPRHTLRQLHLGLSQRLLLGGGQLGTALRSRVRSLRALGRGQQAHLLRLHALLPRPQTVLLVAQVPPQLVHLRQAVVHGLPQLALALLQLRSPRSQGRLPLAQLRTRRPCPTLRCLGSHDARRQRLLQVAHAGGSGVCGCLCLLRCLHRGIGRGLTRCHLLRGGGAIRVHTSPLGSYLRRFVLHRLPRGLQIPLLALHLCLASGEGGVRVLLRLARCGALRLDEILRRSLCCLQHVPLLL